MEFDRRTRHRWTFVPLPSNRAGAPFRFHMAEAGTDIAYGEPIALVSDLRQPPPARSDRRPPQQAGDRVVTREAQKLIDKHGLSVEDLADLQVIRAKDVEDYLGKSTARPGTEGQEILPGNQPDSAVDRDDILRSSEYRKLRQLFEDLRDRMQARFNRHVPSGELLHDRWEMAEKHGFGAGTSVYDTCLLLGDVRVGEHCWIGPYTVLDGAHAPLRIGDHTSIGTGSQLYTHSAVQRFLTGGQHPAIVRETTVGRCCFVSPLVVIGAGTCIGDHSFVAAASYVEGTFPSHSYIAGTPARKIGEVEIRHGRALLRPNP